MLNDPNAIVIPNNRNVDLVPDIIIGRASLAQAGVRGLMIMVPENLQLFRKVLAGCYLIPCSSCF